MIWNKDNIQSVARSALKIIGALCVAAGFATAGQIDQITSLVLELVGTVLTLVGLFMSLWKHTPDAPPVTLVQREDGSYVPVATLPPKSILPPAEVAAAMAQHPEPTQ